MARILLLSDEPKLTKLTQTAMESAGYEFECRPNTIDSLSGLESAPPDVIIVDGLDHCNPIAAEIRKRPALADIRVIVLTAKANNGDIMHIAHGADMFLTKPFNPAELKAFIKRLLAPPAAS